MCYETFGCVEPIELISNGFCNDETNNEECQFDGNDCCGACANTELCSDCNCHDENQLDFSCKHWIKYKCRYLGDKYGSNNNPTIFTGCESDNPLWIGDGYCDDETNTEGCNFDGGDCCGSSVNDQYCEECICY